MSYQIIARKWRPQRFDEVISQDHISKTIKNSITMGRISHAYLFSGPRGVGKTTMARILAKALNCLDGEKPTDDPCGKCNNCVEIRNGSSFDVIEIDGASNRGIENIRELRENVNLAPVRARYKVYIIDEIHMLTKEAFNALLKTLEEPPDHVVFIFATTEIHRIPETIHSRCQKYFFKKIQIEPIVSHLRYIVDREGYKIDERALYPIARASEGSMRDAQSILDQAISFSDGDINEEDALSIIGVVTLESYIRLLTYINSIDVKQSIDEIDRIVTLGVDMPRYIAGLMDIIRTLRLLRYKVFLNRILGFSEEEINRLKEIADNFYDEELSIIFTIASDLQREIRYSANERVHLEMALLDMMFVKKSPSIASLLQKIEDRYREDDTITYGSENNSYSNEEAPPRDVLEINNNYESEEKKHSIVDNIINLFHGEIIEKGEGQ